MEHLDFFPDKSHQNGGFSVAVFGVLGKYSRENLRRLKNDAVCCERNVKRLFFIIPFTVIEYGCFLKWWYPQDTPKWSFLVGKPMVVGYHHFRKPPYGYFLGIYVRCLDMDVTGFNGLWTPRVYQFQWVKQIIVLLRFYTSGVDVEKGANVTKNPWLFTRHLTPKNTQQ